MPASVFTIGSSRITEIEYSLWPEDTAADGGTYCFRIIDSTGGRTITYTVYPQIIVSGTQKLRSGGSAAEGFSPPLESNASSAGAGQGGGSGEGGTPAGGGNQGGGGQGGGAGAP